MSKRGGASEINGFISINADDKKSVVSRKDNAKTTKVVKGETTSRHHRDPSREKSKNVKTSVSKQLSSKDSPAPIAQHIRREVVQAEKTVKVKDTSSTSRVVSKVKNEVSTPSPKSSKTLPSKSSDEIKHKPQDSKVKRTSTQQRMTEPHRQRKLKEEQGSDQTLSPNIRTKTKVPETPSRSKPSPSRRPLTKQSTFSVPGNKPFDLVKKDKVTSQTKTSTRSSYMSSPRNVQLSKVKAEKSQKIKEVPTESKVNIEDMKQHADAYMRGKASTSSPQPQREESEEKCDYEDDFEDYESDFEEYEPSEDTTHTLSEDDMETESEAGDFVTESNSQMKKADRDNKQSKVEEERKLDSGSYDLASNGDLRRKKQIEEIKSAINKENASVISSANIIMSPEDEGFEDSLSRDSTPTFVEINANKGLINFTSARERQIKQKAKEKVKHRGTLLLDMIRLDIMHFDLFDLAPVPYEVYIKCYGRSNTQQMHSQTGEDNLSEEVQTDEITNSTKWTQHPVHFSSPSTTMDHHTFIHTFSQERLGVGGEMTIQESEKWNSKLQQINTLHMHNFISTAGEVMLILLEESERESQNLNLVSHNKQDFGFSDGYTDLNVQSVPFLKDRSVNLVCFSQSNASQILTVHQPSTESKNIRQESESRCLLCVWSVLEPSSPQKILVVSNHVSAVSFHSHLVFAGLIDGSLCIWDLREKGAHHQQSLLKQYDWILRSPTYITAVVVKDKGHLSTVVSVQILPDADGQVEKSPTQVVTVDEVGTLIVWSVIETTYGVSTDMGLAHWGKVKLIPSSRLFILECFPSEERSKVQCQCLAVDLMKPSNLYIGTNTGQVVHCLLSSTKTRPQTYLNNTEELSSITCLEFSKCGQPTLMVGDNSGRVRVYRTASEKPILNLFATVTSPGNGVKSLQMSPCHPGLFFVLDTNSSLHVWDLCAGDLYPMFSVPFKKQVICTAQISPHCGVSQMALATTSGQVQIHHLKSEFCQQPPEVQLNENSKFERYINIL